MIMIQHLFILMFMALIMPTTLLATTTGDEILAVLHTRVHNNIDLSEVYDLIEDLPSAEANNLHKRLERAWPSLVKKYTSSLESAARQSGGNSREHKTRIRNLRRELAALKSMPDPQMKVALKKRGMPILNELRTLLLPSTQSIIATADERLQQQRRILTAVAQLRDTLIEVAIIPSDSTSKAELLLKESEITQNLSGLDPKGLRIIEKNRKIAEQKQVPEPERKGVEDANIMRLLAGYEALEIDPKLCASGRDHSKDMEAHNFFDHTSPVKGKKTPWDRAKNFGTTASGENIYMGSTDPLKANLGWFFSPGHHRNMFKEDHKRIGLGQHNRHWTQLFGR